MRLAFDVLDKAYSYLLTGYGFPTTYRLGPASIIAVIAIQVCIRRHEREKTCCQLGRA